jgi:hypothetical protein
MSIFKIMSDSIALHSKMSAVINYIDHYSFIWVQIKTVPDSQ